MKIRIRDNSIRLRLTRGEVEVLHTDGMIRSRTGFPGEQYFTYSIESSPACVAPGASCTDNAISVRLPESLVLGWATTDRIAMRAEQQLDDGDRLAILVEKDFACPTAREGEDESDMFERPDNNEETG